MNLVFERFIFIMVKLMQRFCRHFQLAFQIKGKTNTQRTTQLTFITIKSHAVLCSEQKLDVHSFGTKR